MSSSSMGTWCTTSHAIHPRWIHPAAAAAAATWNHLLPIYRSSLCVSYRTDAAPTTEGTAVATADSATCQRQCSTGKLFRDEVFQHCISEVRHGVIFSQCHSVGSYRDGCCSSEAVLHLPRSSSNTKAGAVWPRRLLCHMLNPVVCSCIDRAWRTNMSTLQGQYH